MKRLIFFMLFVAPLPAFAGEAVADGVIPIGLKLMGALVIVLGVVLLLYAISRKGIGFLPSAKGGAIKIVEMRHLGPKKMLCLVEVRGEEMLLGVGADRVELVSKLGSREKGSFEEDLRSSMGEKP